MACPSGCLNGGGQSRGNSADDKLLSRVEEIYKSLKIIDLSLESSDEFVAKLYQKYFPTEEAIENLLYTKFRVLAKDSNNFNVAWYGRGRISVIQKESVMSLETCQLVNK
ncbi:cytosolic Fe-S cluster assembly factor narfl-like protein [Leptotrombidium deliense]|uniref:Cytosolic Fe-S cluster assembly factor narfl-like protein n=1 Tax=Leptotrombidium deliense TaxID=299467 RepID=A0A443S370_9ACAR|nr:cytosolic Fe-S cluster assembly factor narfl-like protein [Leptotrombidium deliense]